MNTYWMVVLPSGVRLPPTSDRRACERIVRERGGYIVRAIGRR